MLHPARLLVFEMKAVASHAQSKAFGSRCDDVLFIALLLAIGI
jgi:hypothetical protein